MNMTESEFLNYSDRLFAYLDKQIEILELDIDSQHTGNVLTLECDDTGEKIIINRHTPNQELWIASKSGGYHFSFDGTAWRAQKDGSEFFAVLNEVMGGLLGQNVEIEALNS